MPAYTIVTTSATEGSEAAEVNTLTDDFANESEAVGYSRRMAEEMIGMAGQLLLDFDCSSVSLYDGDLLEEDLEPEHPAFIGMWVLDLEGAAFVSAEEYRAEETEAEPA